MTRTLKTRAPPAFPFLRWFPLSAEKLRADMVAGITVALILVPQSMTSAQLAGLPVVYGLGEENLFGSSEVALQTLQARLSGASNAID